MSIIADALKKSEEGKDKKKPAAPSPQFDAPSLETEKAMPPPQVDLLPDREVKWLDSLSHWAKQVNPWMIWTGMGVSVVFATIFFLFQESRKEESVNVRRPVASPATAPKESKKISRKEPLTPTQFLKAADYELTGISVIDGARIAIVNDKLVREGDWVDGARVLEIKPQEVILEHRGEKLSRELY